MFKYAEMLKKADPPSKGVNSTQYRETGKDPLLEAKPEGAGKFDEGDWGYAALGAGLGGGAAWLLGRLIHGDKFRRRKWLQLLYALGGAGLGGAGGLLQGRDIVRALTADAGEKGEWDPESRTYKPEGWKARREHDRRMWLYRGTGALGGGAAGVIGGAKAGGSIFDKYRANDMQVKRMYDTIKHNLGLKPLFKGEPINMTGYRNVMDHGHIGAQRITDAQRNALEKAFDLAGKDLGNARLKYQGVGAAAGGIGGALGGTVAGELIGRLMIGKGKQLEG